VLGTHSAGGERPCGYGIHPPCYGYFNYIIVLGGPGGGWHWLLVMIES